MSPVLTVRQLTELPFIHGPRAPEQREVIPAGPVVVISQRLGMGTHFGMSHQKAPYSRPCSGLCTLLERWHLLHSLAPGIQGPFRVLCSSQKHARVQRPHVGLRPDPLGPEERLKKIRVETSNIYKCVWSDPVSSQLQSFSQVP